MARQMKDSGIEWIKQIPNHWNITRGKNILQLMKRSPEQNDEVVTCFRDGEVTLRKNRREKGFTFSDKEIGYQGIKKGDIVIHGMDGFAGAIGISDSDGKGSPVLVVCTTKENARYIVYYLRVLADQGVFVALATGIRERSCDLRWNKIADLLFPIPEINEQYRIANYLDHKCSQIDAIIARQQEVIEKLKAYKLSVISEAVTKGLDPNVPMKDSGVEWIGKIPEHWEFRKIKNCCDIVDCKNRTPEMIPDGDYIVVRTTCIKDGAFSYDGSYRTDKKNFEEWTVKGQPRHGDIFFTREAPMGEACLVPDEDNLCMGQRVMFFRPIHGEDPRFILYSIYGPLAREYIESKNKGSTVGHLKLGQVASLPLLYCAPEEQKKIANYLDEKCKAINELISCKQEVIGKLQQYKKSLIYEIVTGKKEI